MRPARWSGRIVRLGLLPALTLSLVLGGVAFAQEARPKTLKLVPKKSEKDSDADKQAEREKLYQLPEKATPQELLKFVDELQEKQIDTETRAELVQHAVKVQQVTIEAADRILKAKDVDDETATAAVEKKLQALSLLARVGEEGAADKLKKFAESLKNDKRPDIATAARTALLILKAQDIDTMSKEDRKGLVSDLFAMLNQGELTRDKAGLGLGVAQLLERFDPELAGDVYTKLTPLFEKSEDEALQEYASRLEGTARRLKLLGNQMELTGQTLEGKKFDWSQYRGKVVLVDFWATWCGPCVAELPNVKENYDKYHGKGFDVVGISLDEDRDALKDFVKEREIAWVQLFEPEKDNQGWEHPMAKRYGVSGIPTTILVDKRGKVVSLSARGEELSEQLAKLLGPADEKPAKKESKKSEK